MVKIDEIISNYRKQFSSPAECRFFGLCGGCSLQNLPYRQQLEVKREFLRSLFRDYLTGDLLDFEVVASKPFRYRNRMDFVCAFGKVGLREAGNYRKVVDISSCSLMQQSSEGVFKRLRELIIGNVEDYDYIRHQGYLRYIVLRQTGFTDQVMVNFVVAREENLLNDVIEEIKDRVSSINLNLNDRKAEVSFGKVFQTVKGEFIEELFDNIKLRINHHSFFQPNSEISLKLYQRIKEEVYGDLLDLYCGAGSISLFVADRVKSVVGVELSEDSVAMAEQNKRINNIENVDFFLADVKKFLSYPPKTEFDIIVVDPPRAGLTPKIIKKIVELNCPKIIYVSCNPLSLKRDLEGLKGYRLKSFQAFDMFPQTKYVESLAILEKL